MLDDTLKAIFPGAPRQVKTIELAYKRPIDAQLISRIGDFLQSSLKQLKILGLDKIVVGLSGGLDSVMCCALLKETLGNQASAIIVALEEGDGYSDDTNFSIRMAEKIGIKYQLIDATRLYAEHLNLLAENSILSKIHLRSRLINNIIFQIADNCSAAVIETTDKSEQILSLYAESFRGHINPIIDLYKSELYDLSDYFSLSEMREKKSGCPRLVDIDAFGVDWDILDPILHLLAVEKLSPEEITQKYGLDSAWLTGLQKRITTQPVRIQTQYLLLDSHSP